MKGKHFVFVYDGDSDQWFFIKDGNMQITVPMPKINNQEGFAVSYPTRQLTLKGIVEKAGIVLGPEASKEWDKMKAKAEQYMKENKIEDES